MSEHYDSKPVAEAVWSLFGDWVSDEYMILADRGVGGAAEERQMAEEIEDRRRLFESMFGPDPSA